MLNTLIQNSWRLAITLTGVYQQGAVAPGAAAIVIATLFKAMADAILPSFLPQLSRDQLASSRARITVPLGKSPAKTQEHHHAYQ